MEHDNLYTIRHVSAREILDSRGQPTVEAEIILKDGTVGRASVPSGASVGANEVLELRDADSNRFNGKGTIKAITNIKEKIGPALVGKDARKQQNIDKIMIEMDGTSQKSKLGGNAMLAVSLAVMKAAAIASDLRLYEYLNRGERFVLPVPMMNVINGGKHAGNDLRVQEFMIIPAGFNNFPDALRAGVEVYQSLRSHLKGRYGGSAINVGDEGGFAPPMKNTEEALDSLVRSIELAGYVPAKDIFLGLDLASTNFFDPISGKYNIDDKNLSPDELLQFYISMISRYPIRSIEDPFFEEDYNNFASINEKIGQKVQIVGDDIFTTNYTRLSRGIDLGSGNALIFKLNQVGTVSEAFETFDLAKRHDWNVIVSHRSGETEDTYIADISVGRSSGQIKAGAPCRGERTAKYNQLLRIHEDLGSRANFAKIKFFS